MTSVQHVPAWKRLGLKLKNAPAEATVTNTATDKNNDLQRHEKRKHKDTDSDRANKKSKSSDLRARDPSQSNGHSIETSQPTATDRFINSAYGNQSRIQSTKTPRKIKFDDGESTQAREGTDGDFGHSLSRKKSVTFTPETKLEDGESGQVFAKAWLAPRNGQPVAQIDEPEISTPTKTAPKATAASNAARSHDTNDKVLTIASEEKQKKPPKKPKPSKKERKQKKAQAAERETSRAQTAWSEYLLQYSEDRSNWKFSKNTQNAIYRHIWNLESLPSTLTDALVNYTAGLQGQNIRTKVADEAAGNLRSLIEKYKEQLEIADVEDLDMRKSQDLCDRALKLENDDTRSSENTEVGENERLKYARACAIFYDTNIANDSTATIRIPEQKDESINKGPINKRKARKSRTAADDSDSDSSSDSSSSSSSSDSDSDSDTDSDSTDSVSD